MPAEKTRPSTDASALMTADPGVRCPGGVTRNAAVAESPDDITEKGSEAGVEVQPAGRRKRNVPVIDRSTKLVALTTRRCGCGAPAAGTTRRSESSATDKSGTTFTSRRNSPRTRSANRY